eukprot:m.651500 g.651500  ORF g.651500 m.651500 type:complete len:515 (+) comp22676_c3_seq3:342-1886(+)
MSRRKGGKAEMKSGASSVSLNLPLTPGTPEEICGMYTFMETIGIGSDAIVRRACHTITNDSVAVKIIKKDGFTPEELEKMRREVNIMRMIEHKHVVRLYQVLETESKLYMFLEFGEGGDLQQHIVAHGRLSEPRARNVIKQVSEGLKYCHNNRVAHRDLKAENILFTDLRARIVKLADFGFGNTFDEGAMLHTMCGSLMYSAPEVLLEEPYDGPAADMWSLGCILYLMVCGSLPFYDPKDAVAVVKVMDVEYEEPEHCSRNCIDLIANLLVKDPAGRLTVEQVIAHPWLDGPVKSKDDDDDEVVHKASVDWQPKKGSLLSLDKKSSQSLGEELQKMAETEDAETSPSKLERRATLVARDSAQIDGDKRAKVIEQMVKSGFKHKDIKHALAENTYDYISSTFYLLLEQEARGIRKSTRTAGSVKRKKTTSGGGSGADGAAHGTPAVDADAVNEEGDVITKLESPKERKARLKEAKAAAKVAAKEEKKMKKILAKQQKLQAKQAKKEAKGKSKAAD